MRSLISVIILIFVIIFLYIEFYPFISPFDNFEILEFSDSETEICEKDGKRCKKGRCCNGICCEREKNCECCTSSINSRIDKQAEKQACPNGGYCCHGKDEDGNDIQICIEKDEKCCHYKKNNIDRITKCKKDRNCCGDIPDGCPKNSKCCYDASSDTYTCCKDGEICCNGKCCNDKMNECCKDYKTGKPKKCCGGDNGVCCDTKCCDGDCCLYPQDICITDLDGRKKCSAPF